MIFFFNDTATTEIYTLSLHDALPIYTGVIVPFRRVRRSQSIVAAFNASSDTVRCTECGPSAAGRIARRSVRRSEEHTSELQSRQYLVCRLLLEKKKVQKPALSVVPLP